jgi:uncharacterized protein (TIGR02466 family)
MKIELFKNIIWKVKHNNYNIHKEICNLVSEIEFKNDRSVRSHISVGCSNEVLHGSHAGMYSLTMFNKYEDILTEFLDFVELEIQQYCKSVEWKYTDHSYLHSWINVASTNTSQEWHTHANSTISGVYYHNTTMEQGGIIFKNPNPYIHMNLFPGLDSHPAGMHFIPEPNTLFLFPSWMEHKTEKNRSNRNRTSIAFNVNTY